MEVVTYSKNIFIPLTRNCRNRCAYCGFRSDKIHLMSKEEVTSLLKFSLDSKEALFTFGEKPDLVYKEIRNLLKKYGFKDFIDYVAFMNKLAIKFGLLPHTNAGVLNYYELKTLKPFNASMGLMLEQAVELECHSESPGKKPEVRIRTIKSAGKLHIPFTTGILVGIGESSYDREYSLEVIEDLHQNYGHIQEVIVQNFVPKKGTKMENQEPPSIETMIETVRKARQILSPEVTIQIPPNLVGDIYPLIKAGARDIGGISDITHDYINPDSPWPSLSKIRDALGSEFILRERLPVYPKFVKLRWYGEYVKSLVELYSDDDGYARSNGTNSQSI